MRALTKSECCFTGGGAFIEGFITDDFAVAGAVAGLVIGVIGLGLYAPSRYPYKNKTISFTESIGCVLGTAWLCAKYGLVADAIWTLGTLAF